MKIQVDLCRPVGIVGWKPLRRGSQRSTAKKLNKLHIFEAYNLRVFSTAKNDLQELANTLKKGHEDEEQLLQLKTQLQERKSLLSQPEWGAQRVLGQESGKWRYLSERGP